MRNVGSQGMDFFFSLRVKMAIRIFAANETRSSETTVRAPHSTSFDACSQPVIDGKKDGPDLMLNSVAICVSVECVESQIYCVILHEYNGSYQGWRNPEPDVDR